MIKDLTFAFIRGYGSILYKTGKSKWLVPEEELRPAGKERLQFTRGEYTADGPNAHFYRILEPLWWTMRALIFEEVFSPLYIRVLIKGARIDLLLQKPPPKRPGQPPKRKFDHPSIQELGADNEYQGYSDTELEIQPRKDKSLIPRPRGRPTKGLPKVSFEQRQQQTLNRIEREIDLSKRNGSWMQNGLMKTDETDEAIFDLILRLHKIRCESDPEAFVRSWEIHLGRLDEIEEISDLRRSPAETMEKTPNALLPAQLPGKQLQEQEDAASDTALSSPSVDLMEWMGEPTPSVERKNLANESFNTNGLPSVLNQLRFGEMPLVPSAISVYIMTTPVSVAYQDSSYHWPDAPVSVTDCQRFWDGIAQRAEVRNISGYVLSYGWNDVMRSIHNFDEGRRHGFSVLREEILKAARLGVTRWRLKVLVSGDALGRV
jgi:hypothetical protein